MLKFYQQAAFAMRCLTLELWASTRNPVAGRRREQTYVFVLYRYSLRIELKCFLQQIHTSMEANVLLSNNLLIFYLAVGFYTLLSSSIIYIVFLNLQNFWFRIFMCTLTWHAAKHKKVIAFSGGGAWKVKILRQKHCRIKRLRRRIFSAKAQIINLKKNFNSSVHSLF